MASLAEQLREAAGAGNADKVHELCKDGIKIDQDLEGRTALHLAAANGHLATVKALVNAGAKVNARDAAGYSPLHQAATEGHEEIVFLLVKSGCLVDTQDELHGNTALHEAAWKGYSRTVEALCKHKANVYIKNNGGFTPLHLACQNGHNQSCRVLLLSGCKPDVKNSYGDTPLHTAARYGHAGVLRILISAFCSASETNKNGDTALHISAAMGRRKLTKILMEAGCDQNIKNNQGETARDIAERKNFTEVVEILDNPPVTLIPVLQKQHCSERSHKDSSKKRVKGSGTSQDDSPKDKVDKSKKSKKKQTVHFFLDGKNRNSSPYGCHMYPNLEFFPSINLKSLPSEPLKKGEQYYADLAGNIKKGPRGMGYVCYCAPFFDHVEKKLDANKKELLKHIDVRNEDLKSKITNLEQKTHDHLFSLNQRMKESLALERAECSERVDRCLLRERIELQSQQQNNLQALKSEMKSLLGQTGNSCYKFSSTEKSALCNFYLLDNYPILRSKSADLLSDTESHHWTGAATTNDDGGMPLSNTSGGNNAYKITHCSENSGAKPKYCLAQSPKLSRLKAKCNGNSNYSRDSRSEGDLTSCHTEINDDSKDKLLLSSGAKELSCNVNNNGRYPHVHKSDIYYKMKTESPGILWNSKHLRYPGLLRTAHVHTDHENSIPSSQNRLSLDKNSNDFYKLHLQKPSSHIVENEISRNKIQCTPSRSGVTDVSAAAVTHLFKTTPPQSAGSTGNGSPSIPVEADGSSFV